MNWASDKGKSGLIKMLMHEHGISKRKAEKAVNAVFSCMTRALKRGERVPVPGGRVIFIDLAPAGMKTSLRKIFDFPTKQTAYKVVTPPKKFIRVRKDKKSILDGPSAPRAPKPPKPPSPEKIQQTNELDQLLTQLGFPGIQLEDLKSLLAVVDDNPYEQGLLTEPRLLARLQARLRQLVEEGKKFNQLHLLRGALRDKIWIR